MVIQSVNKRIARECSIAEELSQTLNWVWQSWGTELDQFTFREGRLTYHQLQQIDWINHPNLYSETTGAAVVGRSSQFWEDNQHREGEEQEEQLEEEQEPLQHHLRTPELTQQEDTYNKTQISEGSLTTSIRSESWLTEQTPIIWFPNEEDWTLWLNEQLDRVFHWNLPGTLYHQEDVQKAHHRGLTLRVADTRTQLLDSYFFLVYMITFLLFITYIRLLCAL